MKAETHSGGGGGVLLTGNTKKLFPDYLPIYFTIHSLGFGKDLKLGSVSGCPETMVRATSCLKLLYLYSVQLDEHICLQ